MSSKGESVGRSRDPKGRMARDDAKTAVEKVLAANLSNLWGELKDDYGLFSRLSVSAREDGSFLAVITKVSDEQGPLAAFGSGDSVVAALVALSASICKGAWKPDRYAEGRRRGVGG